MKTTSHLREALAQAGVSTSLPTLRKYEAKGVIIKPAQYQEGKVRRDRQYTDEEIQTIVAQVREHRLHETTTAQTNA